MHTGLRDWKWCNAGVTGTVQHQDCVITTSRISHCAALDDGTFLIRTVNGGQYHLDDANGGPKGEHYRHMMMFSKRHNN